MLLQIGFGPFTFPPNIFSLIYIWAVVYKQREESRLFFLFLCEIKCQNRQYSKMCVSTSHKCARRQRASVQKFQCLVFSRTILLSVFWFLYRGCFDSSEVFFCFFVFCSFFAAQKILKSHTITSDTVKELCGVVIAYKAKKKKVKVWR